MLIDWFTVGAQVVNFLVLVWLLKRFLYKPILTAIEAREKRIADGLADAATKQDAAVKASDVLSAKNKAFDDQRAAMVSKAVGEAKNQRELLLAEANKAGDDLRSKQAALLLGDQANMQNRLATLTSDEVFAIARSALNELAEVGLEERMSEVFTRRLRELSANEKASLAKAIGSSSEPAVVRSRFQLPEGPRAAIQNGLNEAFSMEVHLSFQTVPEGVCGIELNAHGQKLSWSIASYLEAMKRKVDQLLDQARSEPPATRAEKLKAPEPSVVPA